MTDTPIFGTLAPNAGSTLPVSRAEYMQHGFAVLSSTQRDAITAGPKSGGFIVWNTTTNQFERWNGSAWIAIPSNVLSVANPTALTAVVTASLSEGTLVHVQCFDDYFELLKTPGGGLSADGLRFIAADAGGALWVRKGTASWKNASQSSWFVDATNGNDINAGTSSGSGNALASAEELCRRLCPNGITILMRQAITATFASGSYGVLKLSIDPNDSGWAFIVKGALSSSSAIVCTTITNTNPAGPTKGNLVASTGTPFNGNDKKRVRCTAIAGGASSKIGAIAYICGVNAGGANADVGPWTDSTFTTANLANGDTVVVDTLLTSFLSVDIQVHSYDDGGGFQLQDSIVQFGGNFRASSLRDAIWMQGCELQCTGAEDGFEGSATYCQTRFTGSNVSFQSGNPRFAGVAFQCSTVLLRRRAWAEVQGGNLSDGSRFLLTRSSKASLYKSGTLDAWQFMRGSGIPAAIECYPGTSFSAELGTYLLWGAGTGTTSYTTGIVMHGGSHGVLNAASDVSIPATTFATLAGRAFTQGQLPAFIPRDDCSISLFDDGQAPYIDSTAQGKAPFSGTQDTTVTTAVTIASVDFSSFRGVSLLNTTAEVEVVVTGFSATGSNYCGTFRAKCAVKRATGNITIVAQAADAAENPLGNSMGTLAFTASGTTLNVQITAALTDLTTWYAVGTVTSNRLP